MDIGYLCHPFSNYFAIILSTLPETNSLHAPKKPRDSVGSFDDPASFWGVGRAYFQGRLLLVSGRIDLFECRGWVAFLKTPVGCLKRRHRRTARTGTGLQTMDMNHTMGNATFFLGNFTLVEELADSYHHYKEVKRSFFRYLLLELSWFCF